MPFAVVTTYHNFLALNIAISDVSPLNIKEIHVT